MILDSKTKINIYRKQSNNIEKIDAVARLLFISKSLYSKFKILTFFKTP